MRIKTWGLGLSLIAAMCSFPVTGLAQPGASTEKTLAAPATTTGPVLQLINYAGVLTNVNGKPFTGIIGVTFLHGRFKAGHADGTGNPKPARGSFALSTPLATGR